MTRLFFAIAGLYCATALGANIPPDPIAESWVIDEWPSAPDHVERSPALQLSACESLARLKRHAQAADGFRLLVLRFSESEEAETALISAGEEYLAGGNVSEGRRILAELRRRYARPRYIDQLYKAELALADALLADRGKELPLGGRIYAARTIYTRILNDDPYGGWIDAAQKGVLTCDKLHADSLIRVETPLPDCAPLIDPSLKDPAQNALEDIGGGRFLTHAEKQYYERIKELSLKTKDPHVEHADAIFEEIGDLFRQRGNFALARQLYARACELNPKSMTAQDKLGLVELDAGLPLSAEDDLLKAQGLAPQSAEIAFHCGLACEANRKLDRALKFYSDALEDVPAPISISAAGIQLCRARCLLRAGRAVDAEQICRTLAGDVKSPDRNAAAFDRVLCLLANARLDEALGRVKTVEKSPQSSADVELLTAQLLASLGKKDEAIAALKILHADRPLLSAAEAQLGALQGLPASALVETPEPPRESQLIVNLDIRGLKRTGEEALFRLMGSRCGRVYNRAVWDADFKRLQASGLFKSVRRTEPVPWPGGVSVSIDVEELDPASEKKPRDEF